MKSFNSIYLRDLDKPEFADVVSAIQEHMQKLRVTWATTAIVSMIREYTRELPQRQAEIQMLRNKLDEKEREIQKLRNEQNALKTKQRNFAQALQDLLTE